MNEKNPQFNRPEPLVVGSASLETKKEKARQIVERFGEYHYEQFSSRQRTILESSEIKKSKCEKLAIEKINEITNSILSEFKLDVFNVPERNVHLIPDKLFKEITKDETITGATSEIMQLILLNAEALKDPMSRISAMLHEIIHLKSFLVLEVHEDLKRVYRGGVTVGALREKSEKVGYFMMFGGLNEAIVTEIQKRYLKKCFSEVVSTLEKMSDLGSYDQFLIDEYHWQDSKEARNFKRKLIKEAFPDRGEDEIVWVGRNESGYDLLGYYGQRKVLNYIVDVLFKDNTDRFNSKDEVMKLFFKAHFDGKLFAIAKLIEKSFGEGSFRIIGMMSEKDENSIGQVMDYLQKHRKKI